jgi:hypothetical protein
MLQSSSTAETSGGRQPVKKCDTQCAGTQPPLLCFERPGVGDSGGEEAEEEEEEEEEEEGESSEEAGAGSSQYGTTLSRWCTSSGQW